jgi:hypothetical protein
MRALIERGFSPEEAKYQVVQAYGLSQTTSPFGDQTNWLGPPKMSEADEAALDAAALAGDPAARKEKEEREKAKRRQWWAKRTSALTAPLPIGGVVGGINTLRKGAKQLPWFSRFNQGQ